MLGLKVARWFDSDLNAESGKRREGIDWLHSLPFIGVHLMVLGVIWVGWSPVAVGVAALLYVVRMFALTAFYHRYFSHRTFKTNRFWQFVFALMGNSAVQRGPLWWAAHHRRHHRYSDGPEDVHSPVQRGFWWSQVGWILDRSSYESHRDLVPDLAKYPELRFLDRFHVLVPIALAVGCYYLGVYLENVAPQLGTNGPQMLIWGFFTSTVVLLHIVGTINSLAHMWGSRRYETSDASRNNGLLAIFTLGEGWHNNHHHYQASCRQGFYWWEVDFSWYGLLLLEKLGIVRDIKSPPRRVRDATAKVLAAREDAS